ncbi:VOC family protein [Vibrio fluvialis]|nr:VOC family protein [Vibrio fluvialis]ELV8696001.1 VOC family protein [Vibrio fluvialis]
MTVNKGKIMQFISSRLIVSDIKQMTAFYEYVTAIKAKWLAPVYAEIQTPTGNLALGDVSTVVLFSNGCAIPKSNRSTIFEFMVKDIDSEFERLKHYVDIVHEVKDMPWGNRTFGFRDPEGNLVSFFTPATLQAKQRFSGEVYLR